MNNEELKQKLDRFLSEGANIPDKDLLPLLRHMEECRKNARIPDRKRMWKHIRLQAGIRKQPSRMKIFLRYAAMLFLPFAVAAYFLLRAGEDSVPAERMQVAGLPLSVTRKAPKLILGNGEEMYLRRTEQEIQDIPHAVNKGNELVYGRKTPQMTEESLTEYNTVVVPACGEYLVILADGTKVWLNEKTELKYPVLFTGGTREIFLQSGEVYLEVEKDTAHPFIVHTPVGDVRVLGTRFNVKMLPDKRMAATLAKGSIRVEKEREAVVLQPNRQAIVGEKISVKEVDVEEVICWKDNIFLFKDVRLADIMDKLAEWYGFTVFYENTDVQEEKFFVRIDKYEEVNKILELVSDVSGIKFRINGKTVCVSK